MVTDSKKTKKESEKKAKVAHQLFLIWINLWFLFVIKPRWNIIPPRKTESYQLDVTGWTWKHLNLNQLCPQSARALITGYMYVQLVSIIQLVPTPSD
jgi:hypothetical protein